MKCSIFYFSGSGNTKWAAKKTSKLLTEKGYDVLHYSIEKLDDSQAEIIASAVQNNDYIGFAYPIYGADIPRIVREFFQDFIQNSSAYYNSDAKLFFINTFGYVNGHGYFRLKKLFKKSHLPIMGYVNFRLTNSTLERDENPPLVGNLIPDPIKKKGYDKIRSLIHAMENGKSIINGIGPHLIVGGIIKNKLKDKIKDNYQNMSVNCETCTKCMKCVDKCPTRSIEFTDDRFIFNDTCETCYRCYNNCPASSISMKGDGIKIPT